MSENPFHRAYRQTREFLVVINGILGELENGVDGSIFADLAIYIITRSQRVTFRALQEVTYKLDAWAAERSDLFLHQNSKHYIYKDKKEMKYQQKSY